MTILLQQQALEPLGMLMRLEKQSVRRHLEGASRSKAIQTSDHDEPCHLRRSQGQSPSCNEFFRLGISIVVDQTTAEESPMFHSMRTEH